MSNMRLGMSLCPILVKATDYMGSFVADTVVVADTAAGIVVAVVDIVAADSLAVEGNLVDS